MVNILFVFFRSLCLGEVLTYVHTYICTYIHIVHCYCMLYLIIKVRLKCKVYATNMDTNMKMVDSTDRLISKTCATVGCLCSWMFCLYSGLLQLSTEELAVEWWRQWVMDWLHHHILTAANSSVLDWRSLLCRWNILE